MRSNQINILVWTIGVMESSTNVGMYCSIDVSGIWLFHLKFDIIHYYSAWFTMKTNLLDISCIG